MLHGQARRPGEAKFRMGQPQNIFHLSGVVSFRKQETQIA
jgi:hypothetical protein